MEILKARLSTLIDQKSAKWSFSKTQTCKQEYASAGYPRVSKGLRLYSVREFERYP